MHRDFIGLAQITLLFLRPEKTSANRRHHMSSFFLPILHFATSFQYLCICGEDKATPGYMDLFNNML